MVGAGVKPPVQVHLTFSRVETNGHRLTGRVTAVRGTVIDVQFDDGLPPLDAALVCSLDHQASIVAIVHSHLGNAAVRAIAVDSTRGLPRGAHVESDGLPLRVP